MKKEAQQRRPMICGISVCNPVDIEEEYLNYTIDYAIAKGYDHFQFMGPIHNPLRGNIDGMILYEKYSQFNNEKDMEYVEMQTRVVNAACERTSAAGIKTYMWHHELELPAGFQEAFPNTLNDYGDVEVTSPEVKDFLEHKIQDFFHQYPKMDGIILTLHETRVPLLKLKNQKLDKIGRVKYVTQILFDTCNKLGKELICRPFASLEEDYIMMTKAYEEISTEMFLMDKWTQFDWSLTLPDNAFFYKIKNNPLFVETDIFGEFFGKGRVPLMLKDHIVRKFAYCEKFTPKGYCSRIDRNGAHPFGTANEVNLDIMNACMKGEDVDAAIDAFFREKYPQAPEAVRELMEPTEELLCKIIYLNGYYFSELSRFPRLNHCKNHFYFEMMRENYAIASDEWFIPKPWSRGTMDSVIQEKQEAVETANALYEKLCKLEGILEPAAYEKLHTQFLNVKICAAVWRELVDVFTSYARYFDTLEESYVQRLEQGLQTLLAYDAEGRAKLGDKFYCGIGDDMVGSFLYNYIPDFVVEVRESFQAEREAFAKLSGEKYLDFVICGGGIEGHKLQKEVNFSDTLILGGKPCRFPGTNRGKAWSTVNSHGWFSYEIAVRPGVENTVTVTCTSESPRVDLQITLGDKVTVVQEELQGAEMTVTLSYTAAAEESAVRIRFDRITGCTPCISSVTVR